jgi:hypothetical protein
MGRGQGEWEVTPIDGVDPTFSPRKRLDAPPIVLGDEQFPARTASEGSEVPRLALEASGTVDADSPDDIAVPVTLRNAGPRPLFVRFRPDTVGFDIIGPSGLHRCSWPTLPAAPTPELFVRLLPGARTQMTFAMGAFCGGDSLDQEGLFVVHPWLDTRAAGAQSIGFTAFTGRVEAIAPAFVRLHRGRQAPVRTPPQLAPP